MATAIEVLGRSGDQNLNDGSRSFTRPWIVYDAATEIEAQGAVMTAAVGLIDGLLLTHVDARESSDVQGVWECGANYGLTLPVEPKAPPQTNESSFNFEVSTQAQRVVVPLAPQSIYPRSGLSAPASSAKWLIGQQGDGSPPEGAEVQEPIASFSETHYLPSTTITAAQQRVLLSIVGHINQFSFRGWAAEEVLCAGVSGSQRGAHDWEITFRFNVRQHQTGITVAGVTGVNKKGWQHLWPRYSTTLDGSEPILTDVVDYIVVADVFEQADFLALGIGS
ncbi:MAG: hypothetical protein HUJ26_00145 [Planctomycetaceae bacterium]|nr:hypothetical protein [Planctomycetaceae bacterium]